MADAERLVDDRPVVERIGYWSGERKLSFYDDNLGRLAELVKAEKAAKNGKRTKSSASARAEFLLACYHLSQRLAARRPH